MPSGYIDPLLVLWAPPAAPVSARPALGVQMGGADYTQALLALLPQGAAWPRDLTSTLGKLLQALAAEMSRVNDRAAVLAAEADPGGSDELLPDWERVFGVPGECLQADETLERRRAAVLATLAIPASQAPTVYASMAAQLLGILVTIDEFDSAEAAELGGVMFEGDDWAHIWRINVPLSVPLTSFRAGAARAGDRIRDWGDCGFECQIRRYSPAHTKVLFAYPEPYLTE